MNYRHLICEGSSLVDHSYLLPSYNSPHCLLVVLPRLRKSNPTAVVSEKNGCTNFNQSYLSIHLIEKVFVSLLLCCKPHCHFFHNRLCHLLRNCNYQFHWSLLCFELKKVSGTAHGESNCYFASLPTDHFTPRTHFWWTQRHFPSLLNSFKVHFYNICYHSLSIFHAYLRRKESKRPIFYWMMIHFRKFNR